MPPRTLTNPSAYPSQPDYHHRHRTNREGGIDPRVGFCYSTVRYLVRTPRTPGSAPLSHIFGDGGAATVVIPVPLETTGFVDAGYRFLPHGWCHKGLDGWGRVLLRHLWRRGRQGRAGDGYVLGSRDLGSTKR